mgnify:CR=1 FL=1
MGHQNIYLYKHICVCMYAKCNVFIMKMRLKVIVSYPSCLWPQKNMINGLIQNMWRAFMWMWFYDNCSSCFTTLDFQSSRTYFLNDISYPSSQGNAKMEDSWRTILQLKLSLNLCVHFIKYSGKWFFCASPKSCVYVWFDSPRMESMHLAHVSSFEQWPCLETMICLLWACFLLVGWRE